MRRWAGIVAVVMLGAALIALVLSIAGVITQDGSTPGPGEGDNVTYTYSGNVNAPDFSADAEWINVSAPVSIADLRGKIVLLDFWTYGCINCIHVIPDLKRLEAEYPEALVVIGVHSAKFTNESETENIRRIVRRYEVEHPVINDHDFVTWQQYGVRAWPTFVIIDPLGKVVGQLSGEPLYPRIQPVIETMAREYGAAGAISPAPLAQWQPEMARDDHSAPLRFPGKVLADAAGKRLFISDSNNNRIVVAALDTFEVLDVIGTGEAGLRDGDYATARFFRPQGLALDGDTLYVADTENHALRAVNLAVRTVTTVAGTGAQGFERDASGPGTEIALSSPWDVTVHAGKVYIAMAGPHQLWVYDSASGDVGPYAGTGREALLDGPLRQAAMNQPSGIDTDGTVLYFADPEASAIRTADLDPAGEVRTIVGTGLFDFGDMDGVGDAVRLQHALGVTVAEDGLLYVADTYNNKIKRLDPATRESVTFLGTGAPGFADGSAPLFYEPGGLDYADGKLYIADTNNHAIRVANLATGVVSTVTFPNVERLSGAGAVSIAPGGLSGGAFAAEDALLLAPQTVATGPGTLRISVTMPDGYKLNGQAPFTAIFPDDPVAQVPAESRDTRIILPELPLEVPVTFAPGQTDLALDLTVYWCEAINETLCFVDRATLIVPLTVLPAGDAHQATFERELVPPVVPNTLG
ncbi:MAG: redoxin domain-containing protein [Anaerolineae bacterium]|nr:redoxin domain-containing protein [Anaerolineae bacterium]